MALYYPNAEKTRIFKQFEEGRQPSDIRAMLDPKTVLYYYASYKRALRIKDRVVVILGIRSTLAETYEGVEGDKFYFAMFRQFIKYVEGVPSTWFNYNNFRDEQAYCAQIARLALHWVDRPTLGWEFEFDAEVCQNFLDLVVPAPEEVREVLDEERDEDAKIAKAKKTFKDKYFGKKLTEI